MGRRSLSYENIMKTAIKMVEQKGFNNFSLRELATELQVQPSSLYNHIRGINEIQKAVGLYGIQEMEKGLTEASRGRSMEQALKKMALWYRDYAKNNPELYQAVIGLQMSEDEELKSALKRIVAPIIRVISEKVKEKEHIIHFERAFRSMLHGFISLEMTGYMNRLEIGPEDSFLFMVEQFIDSIGKEGESSGRQGVRTL